MSYKSEARAALVVLLLLGSMSSTGHSQTAGGTILGLVKDPQGALVPSAEVIIENVGTGMSRVVLTNERGSYYVPNLQPGSYQMTVQAAGFSIGSRTGLTLNVGAELVIDFGLQVGNVSETVEVREEAVAVDLASATVSRTVVGSTVRDLPLNGRSWSDLATLQPGMASIGGAGGGGKSGNGIKLTVSGARPSENNFRLDGISLNDNSNSTPGNILGTNLGVEAIGEFSVVSNSYSAEYGRATGGVINAVTKSGANDIHGSAFYFHRNSALDARNFFDGAAKPLFRRHQFGGAAGGPIIENRTFWFANYEGVRESLAKTSITNTLSADARLGTLSSRTANPMTVSVDPQIARLFPMLPLPNGALSANGDTGEYSAAVDKISEGIYFLGKIDHRLSNSGNLSGTYFFDDAESSSPDVFHTKRTTDESRRQFGSIEYTHILSPTLLSVSRFGFSRSAVPGGGITEVYTPLLENPSLGFVPGLNIGSIVVPGITVPGSGPGSDNATSLYFNSFQFHQNLYITRGVHAIKAGMTVERMQYNTNAPNRNGGEFTFGSIANFLQNQASTFGALYPGSDTVRGLRQTLLAGYVQDDVRLRSNVTLNAGLRYEFVTIPTEVNGKIALLHGLTDTQNKVGGPIHDNHPAALNFSPRVGVVWDPFRDGKSSVRAGFGIYDSLPLLWLYDTPLTRTGPFFLQGTTTSLPQGAFPDQAFHLLTPDSLRSAYIETEPPRAYSMKWNFTVQRDVSGWVTEVGYTGSRGVHLPLVERNMNSAIPVDTGSGLIYPLGAPKLNTNFGSINTSDTWNADSYYHGFQASVQKSFGGGMQMQTSYAWSKSIDTASSTGSTNAVTGYGGAVGLATPLLPSLNRGLSDFDIRNNFSLNLVWQVPFGPGLSGPVRWALAGWQVASIYRVRTGTPFSVSLNNDRAGSGTDTNGAAVGQRPNLILGSGCESLTNPGNPDAYIRTQCFSFPAARTLGNLGRNTMSSPGLSNLDFSLFKAFRISERINSQFRIELFNALNRANFGTPVIVVFNNQGAVPANAGQIRSTATESRRIQVGLKFDF
jgi:hypothetical protein